MDIGQHALQAIDRSSSISLDRSLLMVGEWEKDYGPDSGLLWRLLFTLHREGGFGPGYCTCSLTLPSATG